MCGIVGYIGQKNAAEELYEGLTRLEYRGYDSAGICVICGGQFNLYKTGGRVNLLLGGITKLKGNVGIGHTRWATHGEPIDKNAHPFVAGKFAVAHNGIIENYAKIRQELILSGARFKSDTDSEVVVHLLNYYYRGDLLEAVDKTVKRLKGSYALAILCADFDGLCVVKYKSPAIIGFGDGEYYLSSDITALGGKAKTCAVLEDGDIAIIGRDGAKIYDSQLQAVARRREEVLSDGLEFSLGGCPHYMLKEIREDSDAIKNTCDGLLKLSNLTEICAQIKGAKSVILIGCGTAYNSALLASVWLKNCLACSVEVAVAGEARYFPPRADKDTVVLAISQSGETADTVEAANLLKGKGAKLFAVTNAPRSALTRIADCVLPVCAGSEICVAATKSYLGQLACLYLLCGCICGSIDERGQKLFDCAEKINKVVWGDLGLKRIARACANSRAVFFLGRGEDYAVAVEGSLKLKEVSYIFSDAYPAGELKHGTLALIDDSTLSIIIICNERVAEKSLNAAEEILSRKGKVAIITTLPYIAKSFESKIENIVVLPSCDSELNTLTSSAALQLVAYYCALELGRNPDKPRNLAKSVTVE